MTAIRRMRTFASISSIFYIAYLLLSSPSFRQTLTKLFSPAAHPLRFIALLSTVLLNAKSLPFVWHIRLFGTMIYQLYPQPTALPMDALFRPMIKTGFHSPLPECDYNGHKSNSTYFADLDISRTALVSALLRKGIKGTWDGKPVKLKETSGATDAVEPKGAFMVALGGVSCTFKREIKPYERFDIWTRVLSWDKKWTYFVSHIVKAGAVSADEYALQPWTKTSKGRRSGEKAEEVRERWQKAVFATSIAKYVIKKGRKTIHPETIFRTNDLLPRLPQDEDYEDYQAALEKAGINGWTLEAIEKERARGWEVVQAAATSDALLDEFPASTFMMHLQHDGTKEGENGHAGMNGNGDATVLTSEKVGKVRALGQYSDWSLTL